MPAEASRVAVFARAPRPGHAKTRLAPAIGLDGAARLASAFLDDVLTTLSALDGPRVSLWAASEADVEALAARGLETFVQVPADLGRRMSDAMERELARAERVLILGSDVPTLPGSHVTGALEALVEHDVVLGPSADGGYYLVGVRARALDFGSAVRWSTRHALADTLAVARAAGRRVAFAPPWYDVDEPDDLRLLGAHLALRRGAGPATARALAGLAPDPRTVESAEQGFDPPSHAR